MEEIGKVEFERTKSIVINEEEREMGERRGDVKLSRYGGVVERSKGSITKKVYERRIKKKGIHPNKDFSLSLKSIDGSYLRVGKRVRENVKFMEIIEKYLGKSIISWENTQDEEIPEDGIPNGDEKMLDQMTNLLSFYKRWDPVHFIPYTLTQHNPSKLKTLVLDLDDTLIHQDTIHNLPKNNQIF